MSLREPLSKVRTMAHANMVDCMMVIMDCLTSWNNMIEILSAVIKKQDMIVEMSVTSTIKGKRIKISKRRVEAIEHILSHPCTFYTSSPSTLITCNLYLQFHDY